MNPPLDGLGPLRRCLLAQVLMVVGVTVATALAIILWYRSLVISQVQGQEALRLARLLALTLDRAPRPLAALAADPSLAYVALERAPGQWEVYPPEAIVPPPEAGVAEGGVEAQGVHHIWVGLPGEGRLQVGVRALAGGGPAEVVLWGWFLLLMAVGPALIILAIRRSLDPVGQVLAYMDRLGQGDLSLPPSPQDPALSRSLVRVRRSLAGLLTSVKHHGARIVAKSQGLGEEAPDRAPLGKAREVTNELSDGIAFLGAELEALCRMMEATLASGLTFGEEVRQSCAEGEERTEGLSRLAGAVAEEVRSLKEMTGLASRLSASALSLSDMLRGREALVARIDALMAEARGESRQTRSDAWRAQEALAQIMEGVRELEGYLARVGDTMGDLAWQVEEERELIVSVQQIGAKAHLLALNASILASRAGEQDKGFGVVVEQITEMAQQAEVAAVGMMAKARSLGEGIKGVGEGLDQGSGRFRAVLDQGRATASALKTVTESTDRLLLAVQEMSRLVRDQLAASQDTMPVAQEMLDLGQGLLQSAQAGLELAGQAQREAAIAANKATRFTEGTGPIADTAVTMVGSLEEMGEKLKEFSELHRQQSLRCSLLDKALARADRQQEGFREMLQRLTQIIQTIGTHGQAIVGHLDKVHSPWTSPRPEESPPQDS